MHNRQRPTEVWQALGQVGASHLYLREAQLQRAWQDLTIVYRHIEKRAEVERERYKIGAAHQRVLILLSNTSHVSIGDVRRQLSVSKQSFNRVMTELTERHMITVTQDVSDRRIRRLALSPKGREIAEACFQPLLTAMIAAYRSAGPQAVGGFQRVLECMINTAEVDHV